MPLCRDPVGAPATGVAMTTAAPSTATDSRALLATFAAVHEMIPAQLVPRRSGHVGAGPANPAAVDLDIVPNARRVATWQPPSNAT